jgi:16S rRNA (adenine1518-N6/adenine1519-N6)-dimethyltransferase
MQAKKSLGQNFLKSKAALREIVEAADIQTDDIILEIGPGKGILTAALLEKISSTEIGIKNRIVAIEKDDRLISNLQEMFATEIADKRLEIIHGDILEIDPRALGLIAGKYKIVANIPYYITGQFLRMFLSGDCQPSRMVLMLQKEVAKRIVARDKKESVLSISVKAYGQPKYISTVEAKYFSPEPKVDSAILLIEQISKEFFTTDFKRDGSEKEKEQKEKHFFSFVKKGFLHKRKMLAQNLEIPLVKRDEIFSKIGANTKVRAEDISLEQWKKLLTLVSSFTTDSYQ